jgi:hypothetical protein
MNRKHGGKYTVAYLKFGQLAIQKAIAGNKLRSLKEVEPNLNLPRLSTSGLPRYIPLSDRRAILNKSTSVIRYWLTLYALYRIINIPGNLKLNTITDPFSGSEEGIRKVTLELEALASNFKSMFDISILRSNPGLLLLETASPTSKVSWLGLLSDPYKLYFNRIGRDMEEFMNELGYFQMLDIWIAIISFRKWAYKSLSAIPSFEKLFISQGWETPNYVVGQLSRKKEAAGKVRVFAMVDIWTQSIMSPLHKMLSAFLSSLPNDGTKDQTASWKRAAQKSFVGRSFGYDLSAATDRLPVSLQRVILSPIIGTRVSELWEKILVGRDYWLSYEKDERASTGLPGVALRYSVGQPMGALSSFNMLAVTHHLLVQLAYLRTTPEYREHKILVFRGRTEWYDNYEITGDDLVLFDPEVAQEYLSIMADIGVPINESKSVIAKIPAVEYLKVTTLYGKNVSALSWKMYISNNSLMGRISNVFTLLDKDYLPKTGLINWIRDVTCSEGKKDNLNLSLFALLSRYYDSGKITLQTLYESVLNRNDSFKSLKSNLIKGVNRDYLQSLLSLLIKNASDLRIRRCFDTSSHVDWIGQYLRSKLDRDTKPILDAQRLAAEIVNYMYPDEEALSKLPKIDTMPFYTMKACMINILEKEIFLPILQRLDRDTPETINLINLFEYNDSLDRYREVTEIFSRAIRKINGENVEMKRPKFSLKLIAQALHANSWKPTYNSKFIQKDVQIGDLFLTELKVIKIVDKRT